MFAIRIGGTRRKLDRSEAPRADHRWIVRTDNRRSSRIRTRLVEPKTTHTEHEEDGTKTERTAVDDPDNKIHAEEIKIERKG